VWKLVDDLLETEELLSKRKHEKSLLQLLGKEREGGVKL
jgi:hypothetical protein